MAEVDLLPARHHALVDVPHPVAGEFGTEQDAFIERFRTSAGAEEPGRAGRPAPR
jgi:hypothetical protein